MVFILEAGGEIWQLASQGSLIEDMLPLMVLLLVWRRKAASSWCSVSEALLSWLLHVGAKTSAGSSTFNLIYVITVLALPECWN